MGDKTGIGWTDATWNPIRGCSRVSAGCVNCYAEQQAARIVRMGKGKPTAYDGLVRLVGGEPRWTGAVRLATDVLSQPLRWTKPRRIFVNSMSDLFHENFTNEQIAAVFGVMAASPQHTFQVLTKRAARMRAWFEWVTKVRGSTSYIAHETSVCVLAAEETLGQRGAAWPLGATCAWPLPNVWLGVSVENQAAADERIPDLLATPAAVRFLSCEPLIGPVDVSRYMWPTHWNWDAKYKTPEQALAAGAHAVRRRQALVSAHRQFIDWVIAGCESGPGARACEAAWLRSLRNQCSEAGTAFFLKQATEEGTIFGHQEHECTVLAGLDSRRKAGGVIELPYLDGVQHVKFPEVTHDA